MTSRNWGRDGANLKEKGRPEVGVALDLFPYVEGEGDVWGYQG